VDLAQLLRPLQLPIEGVNSGVTHILVHNFHLPAHRTRNSGMFHEPAAFAGYLVLAILLSALETDPVWRRRRWVLVAAVLTTFSTTGYIALAPVFVFLAVARRLAANRKRVYVYALPAMIAVSLVGSFAYDRLPFLRTKIERHLADVAADKPWAPVDRIGNLLYDLEHIERRPLFGWSQRHATRTAVDPQVLEFVLGQGNGLSGFAVRFGLFGIFLYLATVFGRFQQLYADRLLAATAVGIIAILLSSEQYLQAPLFLSLMFISANAARQPGAQPVAGAPARRRAPWRRAHARLALPRAR
jgi:hypothetical protein